MSSWYGYFQLDPHLIASIGFRRRLRSVEAYIETDSEVVGPVQSRASLFYRQMRGCGTTWVVHTLFSLPSALNVRRVRYVFNTVDGHSIAIVLSLDVRMTAGTYMLIYTTCIRSLDPLLMSLVR